MYIILLKSGWLNFTSNNHIFKKGGSLKRPELLEGGCCKSEGDFFQGCEEGWQGGGGEGGGAIVA